MFDIDVIKTRRSTRKFRPEQLAQQDLHKILEAAIYAPSGHNNQPWHFTVLQDKQLIDAISDKTKSIMTKSTLEKQVNIGKSQNYHVLHNAPTVVIVSGNTKAKSPIQLPTMSIPSYSPLADCAAAITTLMFAAHALDIGSCWIGYIQYYFALPEAKQVLQIPEDFQPLFAVCLGYKETANLAAPARKTDVVTYLR